MTYIRHGKPGYLRATFSLFVGAFVTFAVLYTTQPIMPELSRQFHISPAVSSLSLSVSTAALAISMLWVSGVSDWFGRKRLMTLSLLMSALFSILVSVSQSFVALLVLRTLQGIVLAGFPSIAMAYVNEEFHPKHVGRAMGLYVSGTSIGGMVGRIVTGILTDAFSWRVSIGVIGVFSLILAVWFWFNLPRPKHFTPQRTSVRIVINRLVDASRNPSLNGIYVLGFLLMGSFVTMYNYISYLLTEPPYLLSQSWVGFIFVVYLTGTFSSTWMGRLADSIGRSKAMRLSVTISLLGCFITLSPSLLLKIVGLAAFTFGFFGSHAIASGWVGQLAPTHRAQASSLYLLCYYTGSSIAGAVGGVFWSRGGWPGVIGMICCLLALALGVERLVSKRLQVRTQNEQAG